MKTKKYAGGGRADEKIDLEQDVKDFYHRHSSPDFRRKKISEMTGKDVARIPKEAALMVGTGVGVPLGAAASGIYNLGVDAKNAVKSAIAKREDDALAEAMRKDSYNEPELEPIPRRGTTPDQMRSMVKEAELRRTFGPTQDQRDRAARGMKKGGAVKMAKGGSVSSASKRADGCAVKGKTRGMMR
jgi:hypothetical protein